MMAVVGGDWGTVTHEKGGGSLSKVCGGDADGLRKDETEVVGPSIHRAFQDLWRRTA